MRKLLIVAAACAALFLPAPASAADDGVAVIDAFTPENVTAVLNELQATNIKTVKEQNITALTAEVGGIPITLGIQQCGTAGCVGLLMGAGFAGAGSVSAETLLSFTAKYPPSPAIRLEGDAIAVVRAEISLGGLRSSNLKANIAIFVATVPLFLQHVKTSVVATNQSAPALKPAYLSVQQMQKLNFTVPDTSGLSTRKAP